MAINPFQALQGGIGQMYPTDDYMEAKIRHEHQRMMEKLANAYAPQQFQKQEQCKPDVNPPVQPIPQPNKKLLLLEV
jgi:hypothetical protein